MLGELEVNNLLVSLHKWARRQDENFLTEAFAHLLRHLCGHDPELAVRLLRFISDTRLSRADIRGVSVTTQVVTEKGRPDIELFTPDRFLGFIEVKVESGLAKKQLARYRQELRTSRVSKQALVYLTRYCVDAPAKEIAGAVCHRWYQVAEWLRENKRCLKNNASDFLVEQFVGYLEARSIMMNKVDDKAVTGMRSLLALTTMLTEALEEARVKGRLRNYKADVDTDFIGFKVNGGEYYFGIDCSAPSVVLFATWSLRIREDAAELAGGYVFCETSQQRQWINELDLMAKRRAFFDLPAEKQKDRIVQFLGKCLDALPKVKVRGRS